MRRGATTYACCLLLAAAGCHTSHSRVVTAAKPPAPALPVVGRSAVEPDVSALPQDTTGRLPARPAEYRKLTAAECRELAVRNAPFADDLDRPAAPPTKHPHLHPFKSDESEVPCVHAAKGYAADELRNRAAAEALDPFFQLARAEGQFDLLTQVHAEVRARLADAEAAVRSGLRDRGDTDALRVQLLETESQAAQLEAGIGALNASLRARLGLDPCDPLPLWPDDPLRVPADDVDAEQAVRTGLHYRPDLNLLRAMLSCDGAVMDRVAKVVLTVTHPLLAAATPDALGELLISLSRKPDQAAESIRRQVASVLEGRERQAVAEIQAAASTLRGHRAAATARAAEVRLLTAKVADVEKRAAAGQSVTAELSRARLDLLKARGDLLQSATDWHIAEVKLRRAMGLLVRE